jgi:adenylate kinase family enzyme
MNNILIVGSPRVGKTTLAKKISKELGLIYISLDNIFSSIEELKCWPYKKYDDAKKISLELSDFLISFINGLDKDNNYVIEGAYIDIENIYSKINDIKIIGLTYNELDKNSLFNRIKKYDKNEWINKFSDDVILEKSDCFIKRNNYYNNCFKKLKITSYDLSNDYHKVIDKIINELK